MSWNRRENSNLILLVFCKYKILMCDNRLHLLQLTTISIYRYEAANNGVCTNVLYLLNRFQEIDRWNKQVRHRRSYINIAIEIIFDVYGNSVVNVGRLRFTNQTTICKYPSPMYITNSDQWHKLQISSANCLYWQLCSL